MTGNNPFADLTFDAFRALANDPTLSRHEKVGFPDAYREGREEAIFSDIAGKLKALQQNGKTVLEIGPGCSRLPLMLADLCMRQGHRLIFVDSAEMLSHLPDAPAIEKQAGRYPEIADFSERYAGKVDSIIAYSVIQYVFAEGNLWNFLDQALLLLAEGGELLLGDVPNCTMRKRFFLSNDGKRMHREFTGTSEQPDVSFNVLEPGRMDDSVVLGLIARARAEGFHAWVVPQAAGLPMANRREDILIRRP